MKLPNASLAIIDSAKLRDYLLSPAHPVGRFKAPFFARAQHLSQEAQPSAASPYGQKYEIRAILTGAGGRSAEVVSVWIILADEDAPRFVTAYPGGTP